jgi:hypothetical protein
MLPNAELKSWTRMQIARAMRDAVIVAKLETPGRPLGRARPANAGL